MPAGPHSRESGVPITSNGPITPDSSVTPAPRPWPRCHNAYGPPTGTLSRVARRGNTPSSSSRRLLPYEVGRHIGRRTLAAQRWAMRTRGFGAGNTTIAQHTRSDGPSRDECERRSHLGSRSWLAGEVYRPPAVCASFSSSSTSRAVRSAKGGRRTRLDCGALIPRKWFACCVLSRIYLGRLGMRGH